MFCLSFSFNFGFLTKLELIFSIWINVVFFFSYFVVPIGI